MGFHEDKEEVVASSNNGAFDAFGAFDSIHRRVGVGAVHIYTLLIRLK